MASIVFLNQLFDAHTHDLNDVHPNTGDIFVCPICLRIFNRDTVQSRLLTDGHVWPSDFREKSGGEFVKHLRVLQCEKCNHASGSRGEAHMQILQKVREADEADDYYGERRIELLQSGEVPVRLRGYVKKMGNSTFELRFPVDQRTGNWARNNPAEQVRFKQIASGNNLTTIIHPTEELKSHLGAAGLVTGAYLMAFYALGYRYILNTSLDGVRQYILKSFEDKAKQHLVLPETDDFKVELCHNHYFKDPVLELVIPMNGKTPVHLQVSFLGYHVRLPFHCDPSILQALLDISPSTIDADIPEEARAQAYLGIPIACSKTTPHECIWDVVLGKPIVV